MWVGGVFFAKKRGDLPAKIGGLYHEKWGFDAQEMWI